LCELSGDGLGARSFVDFSWLSETFLDASDTGWPPGLSKAIAALGPLGVAGLPGDLCQFDETAGTSSILFFENPVLWLLKVPTDIVMPGTACVAMSPRAAVKLMVLGGAGVV